MTGSLGLSRQQAHFESSSKECVPTGSKNAMWLGIILKNRAEMPRRITLIRCTVLSDAFGRSVRCRTTWRSRSGGVVEGGLASPSAKGGIPPAGAASSEWFDLGRILSSPYRFSPGELGEFLQSGPCHGSKFFPNIVQDCW
jgi:hypothetical protein